MDARVAFHHTDEPIFYSESIIEDETVRAGIDLVSGVIVMWDVNTVVAGVCSYEVITDVYTIGNGGW
jgi:hypothetical protein